MKTNKKVIIAGSPIFIFVVPIVAQFLVFYIYERRGFDIFGFLVVSSLLYIVFFIRVGLLLYYFEIHDSLTIRNRFFFWYKKQIDFENVRSVKVHDRAAGYTNISIDGKIKVTCNWVDTESWLLFKSLLERNNVE